MDSIKFYYDLNHNGEPPKLQEALEFANNMIKFSGTGNKIKKLEFNNFWTWGEEGCEPFTVDFSDSGIKELDSLKLELTTEYPDDKEYKRRLALWKKDQLEQAIQDLLDEAMESKGLNKKRKIEIDTTGIDIKDTEWDCYREDPIIKTKCKDYKLIWKNPYKQK